MLIEDDSTIRMLLVDSLLDIDIEVDGLANAEDALVLLGAGQVPDVLVTDINLGRGLNGIDLASMARAKHPDVEIIFISGEPTRDGGPGLHERFLQKPFSPKQLVEVVRKACRSNA